MGNPPPLPGVFRGARGDDRKGGTGHGTPEGAVSVLLSNAPGRTRYGASFLQQVPDDAAFLG